jgi:hypothetical protein
MAQAAAEQAATVTALEERLKNADRAVNRLGERWKAAAAAQAAAIRDREELEQQLQTMQ